MTDKKDMMKAWVIENMFDCESNKLTNLQRELFLRFVEERLHEPFMIECFIDFQKEKELLNINN